MAYVLKEWDFEKKEEINKFIEHFKKNRRLIVLIDEKKDKSFIIVGDCQNKQKDMEQGRALLSVVNGAEFPSD